MRKILTIIILPFVLFGFDISFNKKFEKKISPDKLSTNIIITVVKEDESEITPLLNSFNKLISNYDEVEKRAGEFSIKPKYKYDKGQSSIVGYNGILSYTIYSTDSKEMNEFIRLLLDLKDNEDISISISGLNWIVSQSKKSVVVEELRLESIIWAKEYVSTISKKIESTCKIKEINISSRKDLNPLYRSGRAEVMMMSKTTHDSNIPIPKATKNRLTINPYYVLECK